ncbi:hypothetical protein [Congregibacter sp.]|uniref:hypothetical protein n=1 Tax=Congregibacter sp. TaxID=2744308 RepID=UPI0039E6F8AF
MSGRYRALLLAVASSGSLLFAWIGAAVVALVMLRKGSREGLWLVLWASLPALLVTRVSGDSSALAMLLGTAVLALVLRASMSLALTAVASAGVALVTGLGLLAFGQSMLAELSALFAQFFAALETQTLEAGGESLGLQPPTLPQLAGMMGTANGALSFLCLALARYWQAELYNPSGFGSEFRELQLPKTLVWALVLAAVSLSAAGLAFRSWGAAMLLPVTVAGFALLHARARHRGQGSFWMSGIYVAWLVFDAAKLGLVGLVLADTMMNFRHRWQGTVPSEADDDSNTEQEQDVGDDDDHQDDTKD